MSPNPLSSGKPKFLLLDMNGTLRPLSATPLAATRVQLFGCKATSASTLPTPNTAAVLVGFKSTAEATARLLLNVAPYDGADAGLAVNLAYDSATPVDLSTLHALGGATDKLLVLYYV